MAYKSIHETFWTDPVMKKELKPLERYLFSYFITNPHSHFSGIYYLAKATILDETGISPKELDCGMHILIDRGILLFDETKEIVFVVNMLKYQVKNAKPNKLQMKGIWSHLENLHNSCLINNFQKQWPLLPLDLELELDTPIGGVSNELDTPIGGVSNELETPPIGVSNTKKAKKKHKNQQNNNKQNNNKQNKTKQEEEEETKQVQEPLNKKICLSPLQELWNSNCGKISRVLTSSNTRRQKEVLRLKERPLEEWEKVFEKINISLFCQGKGNGAWKWKANYDWIIANESNAIKVLEGKYDNPNKTDPPSLEDRIKDRDERREKLGVNF